MRALPAFAAVEACWICGERDLASFHDARIDLSPYREQDPELSAYTGERVRLARCSRCGFAQPERLPMLPRFFERMYDQLWSAEWVASEFEATYKDRIFSRILDLLRARVPEKGRTLLDVGAHAGRFVHLATAAGWQAEGIEVNARTAAFAASRTNGRVRRMSADQLHTVSPGFAAVTLTDVLEHVPEPLSLLTAVRHVLAPAGWITVKVPCGPAQALKEGARARLHRGYTPRLADNLVHVSHFSPRSLHMALARAGFDSIHLEIAAPECPPDGGMSNALRMLLYRAGRSLPFGVHTPLALNLQAIARRA
jgi:SAM-dependent methyltransferase